MGRTLEKRMFFTIGTEVFNYDVLNSWLVEGEQVLAMYENGTNVCAFTNKRLIIRGTATNDAGKLIGKEIYSHSIPYRSISMFSYEVSDTTLLNAFKYVDLWVISGDIVTLMFSKKSDISSVKKILREHTLL